MYVIKYRANKGIVVVVVVVVGIVAIDSCFALFGARKKRAKQLSMATIPLSFEFFRCLVDVLQS